MSYSDINELIGQVVTKIERNNYQDDDKIIFHLKNGAIYEQYHSQDCCESVGIEDINGDLEDLIGYPLIQAEEVYSDASGVNGSESATYTFYKFATFKGYVTIRWFGSSNGYYSESACMRKVKDGVSIREMRLKKLKQINERLQ